MLFLYLLTAIITFLFFYAFSESKQEPSTSSAPSSNKQRPPQNLTINETQIN